MTRAGHLRVTAEPRLGAEPGSQSPGVARSGALEGQLRAGVARGVFGDRNQARAGAWAGAAPQAEGTELLSTFSPLLARKASCLGSRPRNFLSMSEASTEPPGCRMQFL